MISGIRLKVCGLTSLVDADAADAVGADYLGFIFHPASPRYLSLENWRAMAHRLPPRRKVAVMVAPAAADLGTWSDAGFDAFQVHFPPETAETTIASWTAAVGRERLWLAPKLPPGAPFPATLIEHADTIMWDTYAAGTYGGTGRVSDWAGFRAARTDHPDTTWLLAGGLSPANVGEALAATHATFIDVNSGVELAPGVKDPAKLKAFATAIRNARQDRPRDGL